MRDPAVTSHLWWLASRASGVVAFALVSLSVGLGLTMAGRVSRRPGAKRSLMALHEHAALAALVAVAVHGLTLLGDAWLHPGLRGIAVPFAMGYRPVWTGLGIVGGYLAAALGLSFYLRRHIGARLWRRAHRLTVVVYGLALAHALGAGTDAGSPWLRWMMITSAVPIGLLFLIRIMPGARRAQPRPRPQPTRPPVARARPQEAG
jgi:sulfoxide reductase heme-binding subunit YedZ